MKKLISFLLAAAFTCAAALPAANAADWVTVSSWAYNDVSNFTNAGLLPESFETVEDYTQSITRLQFGELVYSVMSKTKYFNEENYDQVVVTDTDSTAARALCGSGFMQGASLIEYGKGVNANGEEYVYTTTSYAFLPDRLLTREETATVLCRIVEAYCAYLLPKDDEPILEPADADEVSEWAKISVGELMYAGIISGMSDGSFRPKERLSIEQAISLIYRLYNALPMAPAADGANVRSDSETLIQTYPNGITETRSGNKLYLKRGTDTLMSFETDIYSNIYCTSYEGRTYAAAQTVKGTTDLYDILSSELLCKIPYPTYELQGGTVVVKSENVGPFTSGIYDYSGNEIIEPKYSLSELDEIRTNGFIVPADEWQEASGWIYYSNKSDGGKLYRIDSNGENREKLSDKSVTNIEFANGYLFYNIIESDDAKELGETPLYCMRTDTLDEQRLTDSYAKLCKSQWRTFFAMSLNADGRAVTYGSARLSISAYDEGVPRSFIYSGGSFYYLERNSSGNDSLWRMSLDGGIAKEEVSTGMTSVVNVQYKDDIVYFIGTAQPDMENRCLYSYDGKKLKKLNDNINVIDYGFADGMLQMFGSEDNVTYTCNMDGSDIRVDEEIAAAKEQFEQWRRNRSGERHEKSITSFDSINDDKYYIYIIYEWTEKGSIDDGTYSIESKETLMVRDAEGNERVIGYDLGWPQYRIGDTLYFVNETDVAAKKRNQIEAYDLNTGEFRTIADDIRYIEYPESVGGDSWFTYFDYSFNICRYNASTDTISEVFPSGSLHRYGAVQRMLGLDDGMYKVDTDGNYSLVMNDETAESCIYVENGSAEAVHF